MARNLKYDSIPFDRMSPDSSLYEKGLALINGAIPAETGGWREAQMPSSFGTTTHPGIPSLAGVWSDPSGSIWVAARSAVGSQSRIWEYSPSAATFTNRTPGTTYAQAPERFRFTKVGNTVIAAPQNDGTTIFLQKSTGGAFSDLVTSPDRPAPRFIGICRSYLVGAYNQGGAGVYASANPYQVMWSARNNAAVFTPATDRSGFAPDLSNQFGVITGLVCFDDFFVVFQEFGATRFTWLGGDAVWDAQAVASHEFGIPAVWSDALVKWGRDVIYLANCGPAAIRNGEAGERIGSGEYRRHLTDPRLDTSINRSNYATGDIDFYTGVVVWAHFRKTTTDGRETWLSLHDYRLSGDSIVNSNHVAVARGLLPTDPMSNVVSFNLVGTTLTAYRRSSSPRQTTAISLTTKRWRPVTGVRVKIYALRLVLLLDNATLGGYPASTVAITPYVDFQEEPTPQSVIATSKDGNGWFTSSVFPLEGNEFDFELSIPDIAAAVGSENSTIRELTALEIAYEISGVF